VQYLRSTIDEMTMNEFLKLPPKEKIEFCKAALKATENITPPDQKDLPALLKKQIGIGDAPFC
jgi:hypothetical protein